MPPELEDDSDLYNKSLCKARTLPGFARAVPQHFALQETILLCLSRARGSFPMGLSSALIQSGQNPLVS